MRRVLFVAIAALGILALGSTLVVGATVAASGLITVRVSERESGVRLFVPVPAALVELGSVAVAVAMPEDEIRHLRRELDEWAPLVTTVLREIERMPDATLVEVEDWDTRVRVTKRGRSLRIFVDSPDALVDVSIPAPAVRRAVGRILG